MGETAILNLAAAAPPTQPAQPSPTAAASADQGDAGGFATELNRQLKVLRLTRPGPGSDAGKGREAGESSPEAATCEERSEQGQSAEPGSAPGTDRLALVAQLFAAVAVGACVGGETVGPTVEGADAPASAALAAAGVATGMATGGAPGAAGTPSASAAVAVTASAAAGAGAEAAGMSGAPLVDATAAAADTPAGGAVMAGALKAAAGSLEAPAAADGATLPAQIAAGAGVGPAPKSAAAAASAAGRAGQASTAAGALTGPLPANVGAAATAAVATPVQADSEAAVGIGAAALAGRGGASGSGAASGAADGGKPERVKAEEPPVRTRIPSAADGAGQQARLSSQGAPAVGGGTGGRAAGGQPTHAQSAPQSASPVPVQSVINQLLTGAKMLRRGPVTELQVQLKPESLGRVDLKVSMENGVLSARILVDNPGVKAALEANLPQLKQSLADQGIALQGMTVGYGGERGQSQGDAQQSLYRQEVRPEPQYGAARELAPQDVAGATQRRGGAHHRLDLIM